MFGIGGDLGGGYADYGRSRLIEPPPSAAAMKNMPLKPRINFPPQPVMDSAPQDGPITVAYGFQPTVAAMYAKTPSPMTAQYLHRMESRYPHPLEMQAHCLPGPPERTDVRGYIQAAVHDEDHFAANAREIAENGIAHNKLRLVFAEISGWVMNFWRTEEEFHVGREDLMQGHPYGLRGRPRPMAVWNLKAAYDVDIDFLDFNTEICPHRIRVLTDKGNIFFRVDNPEDVPLWYMAIKKIIQDANWYYVQSRDRELHKDKRWPAAVGLASCLINGSPIGERALSIAFQCYDIDYDCTMRAGEVMVLIQELIAALLTAEGRAEGAERSTAVLSALSRLPGGVDELFDRAQRFVRRCTTVACGRIQREDFILHGQEAMLEALDLLPEEQKAKQGACSVM